MMSLKNLLGALAITGAVLTCAGCGGGETGGTAATSSAPASAGGMSDADKHKLYQAGAMSGDAATIMAINKQIGLMKDDGMPTDAMQKFMTEHGTWAQSNVEFITSMNTPEKAKEYVAAHK